MHMRIFCTEEERKNMTDYKALHAQTEERMKTGNWENMSGTEFAYAAGQLTNYIMFAKVQKAYIVGGNDLSAAAPILEAQTVAGIKTALKYMTDKYLCRLQRESVGNVLVLCKCIFAYNGGSDPKKEKADREALLVGFCTEPCVVYTKHSEDANQDKVTDNSAQQTTEEN